jgi:hypothetical protein
MTTESSEEYLENLEDSDVSGEFSTTTLVDKYFNFDVFVGAVPSLTRIVPPPFDDLVHVPINMRIEPEKKDKYFYYRSDPSKSILLPHRIEYYYCGCIPYGSLPNSCTTKPIALGEQIYTIAIYVSKRMGRTTSQRWRRECWELLAPNLRISWDTHRAVIDQQAAEDYFNEHSTINEFGERVANGPAKPGRKISQAVLDLSDEDVSKRTKLTTKYAVYKHRRNKKVYTKEDTSKLDRKLNEIYNEVLELGGVPTGWNLF